MSPAKVAAQRADATPPSETPHWAEGAGKEGACGSRPSAIAGVVAPSPVTKKVMMAPGPGGTKLSLQEMTPPALALTTSAAVGLLGQVKMAGTVLPTVKVTGAVAMPWYS